MAVLSKKENSVKLENIKESVGSFWDNMAEGWRHLWQPASGALTRFKPGDKTDLPAPDSVDASAA